jgi:hypothetical protein
MESERENAELYALLLCKSAEMRKANLPRVPWAAVVEKKLWQHTSL